MEIFKKSLIQKDIHSNFLEQLKERVFTGLQEKILSYRKNNNLWLKKHVLGWGGGVLLSLGILESHLGNEFITSVALFSFVFSVSSFGLSLLWFDKKRNFLKQAEQYTNNHNYPCLEELLDDTFFDISFMNLTKEEIKTLFSLPLDIKQIEIFKKIIIEHKKINIHHVLASFPEPVHQDHLDNQKLQEDKSLFDFFEENDLSKDVFELQGLKNQKNVNFTALL